MKKIQNFVLKNQEIFIGLEDSKLSWKLCVRNNGVVIQETSMPTDYNNLRNYIKNKFPECTINVMYEAGFKGFNLYDKMIFDGWNCIVTPPHTVTDEKYSRIKNDRIDCRRLAKNLENGDYKTCFVPDKQLREDRQLSRYYCQIHKDITRVSNRIRRALEFHGLDIHFKPGSWTRGNYKTLLNTLNTFDISPSLMFTFVSYMGELELLWERKKDVLNELKKIAKLTRYKESVKILMSAPGIGILTAMRLILEWGDLRRFSSKEEFGNFLGLIPRENSTGNSEHKGHITKQGNRIVRAMLTESSWTAIRYDSALLDKFQRVMKHNGSSKKAIVAVARKFAIRLRAILLSGQLYQIGVIEH